MVDSYSSVGDNLKRIRTSHDLTQEEFGKIADVSAMAVSQWENHRAVPRMGAVQRISDYFKIPKSEIIDSADEKAMSSLDGFLPITPTKTVPVPVVDHVHAGMPTDPDEADYILRVPEEVIREGRKYVGYIVDGDCMDRVYPEGCLIVIELDQNPRNGSIGVFRIDGYQTVMRRVYRSLNTLILSPESFNPEHRDIVFTDDSDVTVEPIGTVIWFQAREVMN